MEIRGGNILLRPAKLSDAEEIYRMQQDNFIKRNMIGTPKSVAEERKNILEQRKKKNHGAIFVIEVGGKIGGEIGIVQTESYHKAKATIFYWIGKPFRGKGIATKAVKLITDYAFNKLHFIRIQGNVRTFNKASARVLEKAGFKMEGILKKDAVENGKYFDKMVWAKIK
jgi:RimJ/RimL family protein N-acetyltransferase